MVMGRWLFSDHICTYVLWNVHLQYGNDEDVFSSRVHRNNQTSKLYPCIILLCRRLKHCLMWKCASYNTFLIVSGEFLPSELYWCALLIKISNKFYSCPWSWYSVSFKVKGSFYQLFVYAVRPFCLEADDM